MRTFASGAMPFVTATSGISMRNCCVSARAWKSTWATSFIGASAGTSSRKLFTADSSIVFASPDIRLTIVRSAPMAAIGPTAHYTGHVWARNGLSHPALATTQGRALYLAAAGPQLPLRVLGAPTIEDVLLARHLVIDALLEEAIAEGLVGQVLEVACGMSPRGWRFTERHADLVYVEADLPDMAAAKRAALERIGRPARHRVAELDALAETGPRSLEVVAASLDPSVGLAIIT